MIESSALLERLRPAPGRTVEHNDPSLPSQARRRPQEAPSAPSALNVRELFERWHEVHLVHRKDAGESVRRSMLKDVLPWIGDEPISSLTQDDIAGILQRIVSRGSARQAGCVLADVRQLLRWGLREGLLEDDPSAGLHKNDFGGVSPGRSRTLTVTEVEELAARMRVAGLAPHIRTAVWLILATGVRIGEVASARCEDIDLDAGLWTIPAQLSHSGQAHIVPLSRFAVRQWRNTDGYRRSTVWAFPSRDDSEPLSPKALGKQIRDRQRGVQIRGRSAATTMLLLSGGAWTPLDLRRTASSLMEHLGIPSSVVRDCLDQTTRSTSASEAAMQACTEAFEHLGELLDRIEHGSSANTHPQ